MDANEANQIAHSFIAAMGEPALHKLGACDIQASEKGVDMDIRGSQRCNRLRVTSADGGETYGLRFYTRHLQRAKGRTGPRDVTVAEHAGVASLDLNALVSSETGISVYRWN